jgi:type II secretory pathway component PulM
MDLVARYATWWNCPIHRLDKLDEMTPRKGAARTSIQEMVAFVREPSERAATEEVVRKRFPRHRGLVLGDGAQLVDHFQELADRGVERFYTWFTDFAEPRTLHEFTEQVVAHVRR